MINYIGGADKRGVGEAWGAGGETEAAKAKEGAVFGAKEEVGGYSFPNFSTG